MPSKKSKQSSCPPDKVRNPDTGRCVLRNGAVGSRIGGGRSGGGGGRIFNALEGAGYYVASMEPVTKSNYAQVEMVFINKRWCPKRLGAC